jgi:hypothetical protein
MLSDGLMTREASVKEVTALWKQVKKVTALCKQVKKVTVLWKQVMKVTALWKQPLQLRTNRVLLMTRIPLIL